MHLPRLRKRPATPEADKALVEAARHVKEVKSRGKAVSEVSEALRDIREKNHFAERIQQIMEGGPKHDRRST